MNENIKKLEKLNDTLENIENMLKEKEERELFYLRMNSEKEMAKIRSEYTGLIWKYFIIALVITISIIKSDFLDTEGIWWAVGLTSFLGVFAIWDFIMGVKNILGKIEK